MNEFAGCEAFTVWMPSGGLLCPRWPITFKDGKSWGRTGCFGVVWYDEVQPTVSPLPPFPFDWLFVLLAMLALPILLSSYSLTGWLFLLLAMMVS